MIPEVTGRKCYIGKEIICFHKVLQLKKKWVSRKLFPPQHLFLFLFKLKFLYIAKRLENTEKYTQKVMYPYPTIQRQLKTFPWNKVLHVHFCFENYVYFLNFWCMLINFPPENLHKLKVFQQCMNISIF